MSIDKKSSSSQEVLLTLAWLRKQNFRPVPLHPNSKAAISKDYTNVNYVPPPDDLWRNNDYGVGVVTGPAHSGPADVDLDCTEAVFFARRFLPATTAIFGRKTKPASHYLYRVGALTLEKIAFNDPVDNSTIVEMRGDNGHQTVMPGSVHQGTGELIEWEKRLFPEVPTVDAEALGKAVRMVAIATLIARHMWGPGFHNKPTLCLSGIFYYLKWPVEDAEAIISAVMEFTGDKDKSRIPTVRATYRRGDAGKKIAGSGVLREELHNDKLVDRLLEWAGSPVASAMAGFNDRYAIVNYNGAARVADLQRVPGRPPIFMTLTDFSALTSNQTVEMDDKPVPKSKIWMADPRRNQYGDVGFYPGVDDEDLPTVGFTPAEIEKIDAQRVAEIGMKSGHRPEPTLNLWTGWAVEPDPEGSCEAWLELLRDVIAGTPEEAIWLEHWFADIFRNPRRKPMTAPVIIGIQGAGKSLLVRYVLSMLGSYGVTVTNDEHVHGKFNTHIATALLLHSEEALFAGERKHRSVIKSLITDEKVMLETKNVPAVQIDNYTRLVLTSNDPWAAPVENTDRRFTVIDMLSDQRRVPDELKWRVLVELFGSLDNAKRGILNGRGPGALLHHFQSMEFDPLIATTALISEAKRDMADLNLSPVQGIWLDMLEKGELLPPFLQWAQKPADQDWPEVISASVLYEWVAHSLKIRNQRPIPKSHEFGSFLRNALGGKKLDKQKRNFLNDQHDDTPPTIKALDGQMKAYTAFPPLAEARAAYERYTGYPHDWTTTEMPKEDEEARAAEQTKKASRKATIAEMKNKF